MDLDSSTFTPIPTFKGVFGGSGQAVMGDKKVQEKCMQMTGKKPSDLVVIYLGTATYDDEGPLHTQTMYFAQAGAKVIPFNCTCSDPTPEEVTSTFDKADIVMVSGGNTLYAVDRWIRVGIDKALKKAMYRGCVLAGGSAGAICWFDAGHSDSMDPTSYLVPGKHSSDWEYIRVDALGLLPGLLCPHHDRTQSNGVKRAIDFDGMLNRHKSERGVCIDHWAVLVIDGEDYQILSFEDGATVSTKEVQQDGSVQQTFPPKEGKVVDILRKAQFINKDPKADICRKENKQHESK